MYSFTLTGATSTVLDPLQSARRATVTVVASDDPYGIIEFQSASPLNVSEDVGFVNLTVVRNGGSIGALKVNYSVSSATATEGADYESFGSGKFLTVSFGSTLLDFIFVIIASFKSCLSKRFYASIISSNAHPPIDVIGVFSHPVIPRMGYLGSLGCMARIFGI